MSSERISQLFNNNPQGLPKADGGFMYKWILKNTKLKIGKRGQKTELTGEVP
jgi:hypothetical protein